MVRSSGIEQGSLAPVLKFRGITKAFRGQVAVDNVTLEVFPGEVHGLVGENGAGKSTLIKILAGEYEPDGGEIIFGGQPFLSRHPSEATASGIGFIHQVPALVPSLSVAENVTLGLAFERNKSGLISWSGQNRFARHTLEKVGMSRLNPNQRLQDLSLHERQLVAVARVLTIKELRVVVFDEVTAPLTELEVQRLFKIIREIRDSGVGVIYISHRLGEIFQLADRVTVMKNGSRVITSRIDDLDELSLTRHIIGKDPAERFEPAPTEVGTQPVLSVQGLSDELIKDVTFDVRAGEILGLAGLNGSGRSNILEILFGARQPTAGRFFLHGQELTFLHPSDAVAKGIVLVTEDRQRDGYIPSASIWQNMTLPWLQEFSRAGFLSLSSERKRARELVERFDVRTPSVETPIRELSGGNQQKTILARWLSQVPEVALLDEPTHGVDVGAKKEIYRIVRNLAGSGIPVIVISSEFAELEGMCSRVLLVVEGRIVGELIAGGITEEHILTALYKHHSHQ